MYFLDELKELRMYKKQFYLPLNMDNKRIGSCALLLTPDVVSTHNLLTHSLMTGKYYNGYYLERAVMYYINHESNTLNMDDNADYITEEVKLYADDPNKSRLSIDGYTYDIDNFKKSVKVKDFEDIAKKYDIKLPKQIKVSIRRTGVVMDFQNNAMVIAGINNYNKSVFDSYRDYCIFCIHCYCMKLCNRIIDDRLVAATALYETGLYRKNLAKTKWPFDYALKAICKGIDNYLAGHSHTAFVDNVIKKDNGLSKLEVSFGDMMETILYDGIIKPTYEESISTDYSKGMVQLSEDTIMLFEAVNQSPYIKKLLYADRIKTNQDLLQIYKKIKEEYPEIKYTFTDLKLYKEKNIFFDFSGYNNSFIRNCTLQKKRGYDLYMELLSRMIDDKRLEENGYTNNTVIIPVLDWSSKYSKVEKMWMINETVNPISCIYYSIFNGDEKIKEIFKNKRILFIGPKSYFHITINTLTKQNLPMFIRNIRHIINGEEVVEDDTDPKDSEKAIKTDIIDKVEKSQNVEINNLEPKKEDKKEKIENNNGSKEIIDKEKEKAKEEIVKTADNIAKGKTNSDDALDTISKEDEDRLKKALSDIASSPDNGSDISGARASRLLSLQNDFIDSEFQGQSVKDILSKNSDDTVVKPKEIDIDSVNEDWKHLNYIASVESYDLNSDIVKIFDCFANKSRPLVIRNISAEDVSTSEDAVITYTVEYEDYRGKRYTIKVDIPKVLDKRYMKLRGNRKTIQPMLFLMPIIKTEENTVQIISCYKKIYIRRFGETTGKSNVNTDKLIKALTRFQYSDIKITEWDNSRVCSKYECPIDYIDIAGIIDKINTKNYTFYFNQEELRKKYEVDDSKGFPVGYNKQTKELIYFTPNPNEPIFFSYWLYTIIVSDNNKSNEEFIKNFNGASTSVRYTYSKASILSAEIPLVVVCAHSIGLEQTMRRAHIDYHIYSDKRPSSSADHDVIKFKDGWLEYKLDYNSSLLMNGLKACPVDEYSINDINNKAMYVDFLESFGGRIKSDGLDNFYDCMIDPITKETLEHYKLPTDYIDALLYANTLLSDNKFVKHGDIRSTRRIRRVEQIADFLYKEMSTSYGVYNTGLKHGKDVGFTIKQSSVIDAFMTNNTTSDQSVLNALGEYEDYNAVTPKGSSGMNSDRAYSLDKRSFDDSMVNVLSTSTGFAGNVGVTRQATIDANVVGPRGYIYNDPEEKPNELNGVKALCMTEALSPFATTRDDPMRVAMNFVQTSKHNMRTTKSDPLLISNGADEALPYMISDTFAFKAKSNGAVEEITEDHMIITYADGTRDFVNLQETVEKNSSSGFYVAIKLDTDLKVGDKVKEGDIVAYDKSSFTDGVGAGNNIAFDVGPMAKFAILNTSEGYEDSAIVSEQLSEDLASDVVILAHHGGFTIPKDAEIFNLVKKGQDIEEGDELFILQNAYDDEDANALLKALKDDNEVLSTGRIPIKSHVTGKVQDIIIKRTCELNELSPTLKKIVSDYEKDITNKKKQLKAMGVEDEDINLPATGVLPASGKLKNAVDSIYIEIYLSYHDKFSIGDKLIYGTAVKGVAQKIIPKGLEPRSSYRPEETIDALLSIGSLNARMVTSVQTRGLINKGLIELTRQCKEELGIPTDLDKK